MRGMLNNYNTIPSEAWNFDGIDEDDFKYENTTNRDYINRYCYSTINSDSFSAKPMDISDIIIQE